MSARSADAAAMEAEIDRIRSLGLGALRNLWRKTLASPPPAAFGKDLLVRFLCWHLQEQAFGGLEPGIAKLLHGLARGGRTKPDLRLKPGTVLVREYRGMRHTVTVVPTGYVWRETSYASLSAVARAITGTAWNGHRFFGQGRGHNPPTRPAGKEIEGSDGVANETAPRRRATRRAKKKEFQ